MTQRPPTKKGSTEYERAAEQSVMALQLETTSLAESNKIALAEHAEVIRALGKRVVRHVIEIGQRLATAKHLCKQAGEPWLPWLERQFSWNERTAQRYMSAYDLSLKYDTVSDLQLPMRSLYLLAAPSTPAQVVHEVIQRAEDGERLTTAQIREKIGQAVNAAPEQAQALDQTQTQLDKTRRELNDLRAKDFEDTSKIDEPVVKATAPLQKQIEKYQQKLERSEVRAEHAAKTKDNTNLPGSLSSRDDVINQFDNCLRGLFRLFDGGGLTIEQVNNLMGPSADHFRDQAAIVSAWLKRFAAGRKSPNPSCPRRKAHLATVPDPESTLTEEPELNPELDTPEVGETDLN